MTQEKICPLTSINKTPAARCIGPSCALWDEESKRCSFSTLGTISALLRAASERSIPHEPSKAN